MEEIKTKTTVKQFRFFRIVFESDVFNGEKLDTTVQILPNRITTNDMFVIAGCDIEKFTEDISAVISKYRI